MIYAQVMAGGVGSRMGNTKRPKQFLEISGKPIIVHTLEQFTLLPEFEKIIVSIHPSWVQYAEDLLKQYVDDPRIIVIPGGAERNDTVMGAIRYIDEHFDLTDKDVLVMHDAVRPFVSRRILLENIALGQTYKAVDTVIPATDTIVKATDAEVTEIPIRDEMYQGQTPQTVNVMAFQAAYENMTESERTQLSDSAKVMLLAGHKVAIAEGAETNIKITRPYDLRIAEFIAQGGADVK